MISQSLGGDIICNSEWQKGTNFTFLIPLDDLLFSQNKIKRIKNPVAKLYAKIRNKSTVNQSEQMMNLSDKENSYLKTAFLIQKTITDFK